MAKVNKWDPKYRYLVTLDDRFFSKVRMTDGCWVWTGAVARGRVKHLTYGQMRIKNKAVLAHRLAYEQMVGPIPAGFTIDHLCRNPRCVRPEHLEAVTFRENVLRGESMSARYARRTHCGRGHPFTESNIYWQKQPSGKSVRKCAICARDYNKRRRAKVRL